MSSRVPSVIWILPTCLTSLTPPFLLTGSFQFLKEVRIAKETALPSP